MSNIAQSVVDGLIEAARLAGRTEIMPRFRNLSAEEIDSKSGPDDLVTVADRAAEALICAAAAQLLPDALIVGEEAVHETPSLLTRLQSAEVAVIIDPIDGTANFASGLTVFGVIIAVTLRGQTEAGILYDPVMDDWVMATQGGGAWYCKPGSVPQRVSGRPAVTMDQAAGFVPLHLYGKSDQPAVAEAMTKLRRATPLRCSCHEYRQLALGHADFLISPMAKPWDHAAGVLVIEECGGRVEAGGAAGYDAANPVAPIFACANAATEMSTADISRATVTR